MLWEFASAKSLTFFLKLQTLVALTMRNLYLLSHKQLNRISQNYYDYCTTSPSHCSK